jgi:hypothetical protein
MTLQHMPGLLQDHAAPVAEAGTAPRGLRRRVAEARRASLYQQHRATHPAPEPFGMGEREAERRGSQVQGIVFEFTGDVAKTDQQVRRIRVEQVPGSMQK